PGTSEQEHVVKAAAGITFSLFLTNTGKVLVKGLQDKKITHISCGQQHSIAIDEQGIIYVWGYNGYCRLGLGNQQDVLTPKVVPQFAGPQDMLMGAMIAAGPSNSVVVDRQGMYWMAGKWKNTGDGSGGQPYSNFRYMQDIMSVACFLSFMTQAEVLLRACKMKFVACGGVTHWALAPDEEDSGVMTVCWGQNAANGELGLGPDEVKSSTKPMRNVPLIGIDVFAIAPGQNTTFFLVHPNEKYSDLPRHPAELDAPDLCVVCNAEHGEDDAPLECEKCDRPYHLGCLSPPLTAVPDGEWFCPECTHNPGAPVGHDEPAPLPAVAQPKPKARSRKREEDVEDDEEDEQTSRKRKAPAKKAAASKRKK
ncbi:hypothetical protein EWM64_g7829, partial [Hericium alpestre]